MTIYYNRDIYSIFIFIKIIFFLICTVKCVKSSIIITVQELWKLISSIQTTIIIIFVIKYDLIIYSLMSKKDMKLCYFDVIMSTINTV